ncbi:MAG: hypothetical protein ACI8UO_000353 [Verrucomicrobiales bacterium]|jgi:hypothetical protein
MKIIGQVPWLILSLILFNVLVFSGVELKTIRFSIPLPKTSCPISWNDLILIFSVVILYIELFKSTRTHVGSVIEHVFSLFVFLVFLLEFILVEQCGTATFFILMLLSLVDIIAGFTITISTARRDLAMPHGGHGGH